MSEDLNCKTILKLKTLLQCSNARECLYLYLHSFVTHANCAFSEPRYTTRFPGSEKVLNRQLSTLMSEQCEAG